MQAFTLLALAAAAVASPLEVRNGKPSWGSCPSKSQYTCSANGLANVLVCNSILNNNQISIPITLDLRRDADAEITRRWGDKHPTCCKSNGLLNILTCNDILDGNTVSVPISVILGIL